MLGRPTRLLRFVRQVPERLGHLEAQVRDLSAQVDSLAAELRHQQEQRTEEARAHADGAVRAAREHTEAAVQGAIRASVRAAQEHTEAAVSAGLTSAIAAAREQIDAAVSAGFTSAVVTARQHAEAVGNAVQTSTVDLARQHAEALGSNMVEQLRAEIGSVRRGLVTMASGDHVSPVPVAERPAPHADEGSTVDPLLYVALEDRFRGARNLIATRQLEYLPLVRDLADGEHPVLDLGCGRGEWLGVLADAGVPVIGVDNNPLFVAEVAELGRQVVLQDLVEHLRALPDAAVGAITMFQVIEHLPFPTLVEVLTQCRRVLRNGGLLIAETPNALNLRVAATMFWLDPTHVRPLHPEMLKFLAVEVGFARADGRFVNDLDETPVVGLPDNDTGRAVRRLLEMVDGPGDFALCAWA